MLPDLPISCCLVIGVFALVVFDLRYDEMEGMVHMRGRAALVGRAVVEATGFVLIALMSPWLGMVFLIGVIHVLATASAALLLARREENALRRAGVAADPGTPTAPFYFAFA